MLIITHDLVDVHILIPKEPEMQKILGVNTVWLEWWTEEQKESFCLELLIRL